MKNNKNVRKLLGKQNIKPEELPPEENIGKIGRKLKYQNKKTPSIKTLRNINKTN
jgi:hypothetical protein